MEYQSASLTKLIHESNAKELVLPNFQRSFVWSKDKQKMLVSSFLCGLPSGGFLLLRGEKEDFASREVFFNQAIEPAAKCTYLLDGQQRFSTLKNAFTNVYNDKSDQDWKVVWDDMFSQLRHRFYLKVDLVADDDIFGIEKLNFNKEKFDTIEPSELLDSIELTTLLVKDKNKEYHPGYNPKDKEGKMLATAKVRVNIVNYLAERKLIPLYSITDEASQSMHKLVLRRVAINRQIEIQEELGEDHERIANLLRPVDENIDQYLEEDNEVMIRSTWSTLATNWAKEIAMFLESRAKSDVPLTVLEKNEIGRAFAIFEVINQPGTPLDEYDLVVAKAARFKHEDNLTERLVAAAKMEFRLPEALTMHVNGKKPETVDFTAIGLVEDKSLSKEGKNRFLQVLSMISHTVEGHEERSIMHLKRDKFLELTPEQINQNYEISLKAIQRAYSFLHVRCGIVKVASIPYQLLSVNLALVLIRDEVWEDSSALDLLESWYWASIFSGYFKMDQNIRAYKDIQVVEDLLAAGNLDAVKTRVDGVFKDSGYSDFETLAMKGEIELSRTVHNAILQYVLSRQPYDLVKGLNGNYHLTAWDAAAKKEISYSATQKYELKLEDHHICPLNNRKTIASSTSDLRSNKDEVLNSPLNRTYISEHANRRVIGQLDAKKYLKSISDPAKYNHCIPFPVESYYVYDSTKYSSEAEFYDQVLKRRFEELDKELRMEVDSLSNFGEL